MNTIALHKLDLNGPLSCVRLTRSEAQMIRAFALAEDGLLSFESMATILDFDQAQDMDKSALQVRMVRLRKKILASGAQGSVIESVRNVGYQLFEPIKII